VIVGTGMDIVEIARIQRVYDRFSHDFAKRILESSEYDEYEKSSFQVRFLARRFAAKEAVAKALGTGFSRGINPRMICVNHDDLGRPVIKLYKTAKDYANKLGVDTPWVSISDEREYAAAMAIMEKK